MTADHGYEGQVAVWARCPCCKGLQPVMAWPGSEQLGGLCPLTDAWELLTVVPATTSEEGEALCERHSGEMGERERGEVEAAE